MTAQSCLTSMLRDLYVGHFEDANQKLMDLLEWYENGQIPRMRESLEAVYVDPYKEMGE